MNNPHHELVTRRAERDDAHILAELNMIVQRLHHEHAPQIFKPPDLRSAAALFREWLRDTDRFAYLAETQSEAVGYALVERVRSPGHALMHPAELLVLDQIAVVPEVRRQGVGSALVARVRNLAAQLGIERIDLAVWTFNDDARLFFEAHGFSRTLMHMSMRHHDRGAADSDVQS